MSSMAATSTAAPAPRSKQRWLLLSSLALNLFVLGITISLLVRGPTPTGPRDRSMSARIERVAETLPPADADKLRAQFQANRTSVETARANLEAARDVIRETLRREPFSTDAMRAAMAQTRAARQNYDQALHGVFVSAAEQMTASGRRDMADWRPDRPPKNPKQ